MTLRRTSLRLAALATPAALLAASAASAAPQIVRGMTHSWPNGLSARTSALGYAGPMLLKHPLDQSSPPQAWANVQALPNTPQVLSPDYSIDSIFEAFDSLLQDTIQIDAHSTGNDWIPAVDNEGVPMVNANAFNWMAYVATIKDPATPTNPGTPGAAGSYLATIPSWRVGAELIGFYAQGSQNIASELVGATTVEATALSQGFNATNIEDIDAVDFALGIQSHDTTAQRMNWIFTTENQFYFSVSEEWAGSIGALYGNFAEDKQQQMVAPDSGTIYRIEWDPSTQQWGNISVFMTTEEMDLSPDLDIDAIAVNPTLGSVVFSTVHDSQNPLPQLMIFEPGMPMATEVLDRNPLTNQTTRVADALGLNWDVSLERGVDDIDGICIVDPSEMPRVYSYVTGHPTTSTANIQGGAPELQNVMSVSVSRGVDPGPTGGVGIDSLMLQVNDWGGVTPQDSEVWVFLWSSGATVWPNPGHAILPNADPLGSSTAGGWSFLMSIDRAWDEDTTELRVPFTSATMGTNAAVMAWLVTPDTDPNGQRLLAGSLVTQFGL